MNDSRRKYLLPLSSTAKTEEKKQKKKNPVKFYGATFDRIIIFSSNLAGRVPFPLAAAHQSRPSFT